MCFDTTSSNRGRHKGACTLYIAYRRHVLVLVKHLWFLSKELVALALFDDNVDVFIKDKIMAAMNTVDGEEETLKRTTVHIGMVLSKTLADFYTKNSTAHFKNLRLPEDFLKVCSDQ